MLDAMGKPIPPRLREIFAGRDQLEAAARGLDRRRRRVIKHASRPHAVVIDFIKLQSLFSQLTDYIRGCKPAAVCVVCTQRTRLEPECICGGKGWLTGDEIIAASEKYGDVLHEVWGVGRLRQWRKPRKMRRNTKSPHQLGACSKPTHEGSLPNPYGDASPDERDGGGDVLRDSVCDGPAPAGNTEAEAGGSGDLG